MSLYSKIKYIKTQIIDTEGLLSLVSDHPLMSLSLNEKLGALKAELESLPKECNEAKIKLFFSGNAVKGSLGIKTTFLSNTVKPFQELIKIQTAFIRYGCVTKRVKKNKAANTDLFLTALPTGSFGLELSQLETNDLLDSVDISTAFKQTMELIELTAKSDDEFEKIIEKTPKKIITNLHQFLKPISEANSIIKMESGELGLEISKTSVIEAFDRIDSTIKNEEEVFIIGVFKGFLLDSGRFEIIEVDGKRISGTISEELNEETLVELDKKFFNEICLIQLSKQKIIFRTGREKITYELANISPI